MARRVFVQGVFVRGFMSGGGFCLGFFFLEPSKRRFSQMTPTEALLHLPEFKQSEVDACIALPKEPTIRPSFIAQLAKSHYA